MDTIYHIPALLQPTLDGLNIRPDGVYADLTFGGGGHSRAILAQLGEQGKLYSFDQDLEAYANAREMAADNRWQFVHGNFRYVSNFINYYQTTAGIEDPQVDGILADLGVSFHHFDEAARGFSFRFAGALDMRMNREGGKTAADILNTYSEEDLSRIFYLYGEYKDARRLAHKIAQKRTQSPISKTEELTALVIGFEPKIVNGEVDVDARFKKDLARVYQALRMEVNDELAALREMLLGATSVLKPGGRFAIITYHSLEDRLVKNFFRSGNLDGEIEKDFYGNVITPFRLVNKQVIVADEEEVARNPRARSAKLRVAEMKH